MMFVSGRAWQDIRVTLAISGAALFIALAAGFASATANPYVLVLTVGAFAGIVLLAFPRFTIWIVLIGALVIAGLVQLFLPALQSISWIVSILGFVLLGSVLLSALNPRVLHRHAPAFIWIAAGIFTYGLLTSLIQGSPAIEVVAGVRRYFPMWGLIFALVFLKLRPVLAVQWAKLFVVIAVLQLPFALYQFLILVPQREALAYSIVAIDVVAGTFGASLEGGGSNNLLAAYLVIVIAFLTALWQEKCIDTRVWLTLSILCVLPLFLGETKITILYFLVALLLLGFRRRARIGWRTLGFLFGGGLILCGLAATLLVFYSKGMSPSQFLENILAYNLGAKGHGANELNRLTVLLFWLDQHGFHNILQMLFGHGLGSSFPGSHGLVAGRVHSQYPLMGVGLTAASQLLWDMGIAGAVLLAAMFISAWRTAATVGRRSRSPQIRAGMDAARIALVILALWYPYKATLLTNPAAQVLFASVFGYVGYCWRMVRLETAPHSIAATT